MPSIVYAERMNENCWKYESGYQEFQVLRFCGNGDVRIATNGTGLGVVCEGKVSWDGNEFVAGDSILIEDFVDVGLQEANLMVCCGNRSN